MRILVIEDDHALRLVVRRTLVLAGYDVLLAETGEDGLEQAVTATPDAIILDLGLPDIDGLAVCGAL
jgi:two-component system, OmpR family, KDP operon response regulator KdpE